MKTSREVTPPYWNAHKAPQKLGLGYHLFSRITGSVFVNKSGKQADPDRASKTNIGLNLKVTRGRKHARARADKLNISCVSFLVYEEERGGLRLHEED